MGRKRLIDVDNLLFDDEMVEALGTGGLWVYPILWGIAEDWGGYEPKYGSIALRSGALRLTKEIVEKAIQTLIDMGKILPYQVKGKKYHWIKNFLKHQNLNNPSPPLIPLPPWIEWEEAQYPSGKKYAKYSILQEMLPGNYPETTGSLPVDYQEPTGSPRNETETKPRYTSPKGEVVDGPASPSADLSPSPGVCDSEGGDNHPPLSDTLNTHRFDTRPPGGDKTRNDTDIKAAAGDGAAQADGDSESEVVDGGNGTGTKNRFTPNDLGRLWNETADPVFPRVILPLSEKRARKFRPAVRDRPDPEWWKALFAKAGGIPFLKGENDRGWRADLEFVVRRHEEIMEGRYDRAKKPGASEEAAPRGAPGCPICQGDGWEYVEEGGDRWAKPCRCTTKVSHDFDKFAKSKPRERPRGRCPS